MNDLRQSVKIHTLSWKWVWTELLYKEYGDKMRELANVVDFHGSQFSHKGKSKYQKAESFCPGFDQDLQDMKAILND